MEAELISWNKPIKVPKSCPVCGGDLEFRITGATEDDEGLMRPDCFDVECENDDPMDDENPHNNIRYPYIDWHPHIVPIEQKISNTYYVES